MGKKRIKIKSYTRRVDVKDLWGRYSHWKNVKVKGHYRKKPKRKK